MRQIYILFRYAFRFITRSINLRFQITLLYLKFSSANISVPRRRRIMHASFLQLRYRDNSVAPNFKTLFGRLFEDGSLPVGKDKRRVEYLARFLRVCACECPCLGRSMRRQMTRWLDKAPGVVSVDLSSKLRSPGLH